LPRQGELGTAVDRGVLLAVEHEVDSQHGTGRSQTGAASCLWTTRPKEGYFPRRPSIELQELIVADGDAWRAWLGSHHETSTGVWLVLAKKGITDPTSLTYDMALEEALCHGWIDGQGAAATSAPTAFISPPAGRAAFGRRATSASCPV
jgi:hypothetical protein